MSCRRSQEVDLAAFLVEPEAASWADFRAHYPRCGDCAGEVRQWTELEALVRQAAGDTHPGDEELLAYARRTALPAERTAAIESHLQGCGMCRDALKATQSLSLQSLLRQTEPASAPAEPGWLERALGSIRRFFESLAPANLSPALVAAGIAVLMIPVAIGIWSTLSPEAEEVRIAEERPAPPPEPLPQLAPEEPAIEPEPESRIALEEPPPVGGPEAEPALPDVTAEPVVVAEAPKPKPKPRLEPAPPAPQEEELVVGEPVLMLAMLDPAAVPVYRDPVGAVALDGDPPRFSVTMRSAGGVDLPHVHVLAPEHVGLTVEPSPSLSWYLLGATDRPVQVTVVDLDTGDELLHQTLDGPHAAGIHTLRLADYGVELEPGTDYDWTVSVLAGDEPGPDDRSAGAPLLRIAASPDLRRDLAGADPLDLPGIYARNGLWYDALGTLSEWVRAEPKNAAVRAHRAALLEQAGLKDAAAADLRKSTP